MSGPPHFVDLHVNPGESVSIQLFDGNETVLRGPATVTMISQHTFPPVPMPVQVPPGHMVQQIVDENGTLRHIILSALNNNGTATPAATLIPQQQAYPYCCCCCYCNTSSYFSRDLLSSSMPSPNPLPTPPPPPPPPPPPVHHSNLWEMGLTHVDSTRRLPFTRTTSSKVNSCNIDMTFPAPPTIRRRLPNRNYSYSKRSASSATTTSTPFNGVTTKSSSSASVIRGTSGKSQALTGSPENGTILFPANNNNVRTELNNCELNSTEQSTIKMDCFLTSLPNATGTNKSYTTATTTTTTNYVTYESVKCIDAERGSKSYKDSSGDNRITNGVFNSMVASALPVKEAPIDTPTVTSARIYPRNDHSPRKTKREDRIKEEKSKSSRENTPQKKKLPSSNGTTTLGGNSSSSSNNNSTANSKESSPVKVPLNRLGDTKLSSLSAEVALEASKESCENLKESKETPGLPPSDVNGGNRSAIPKDNLYLDEVLSSTLSSSSTEPNKVDIVVNSEVANSAETNNAPSTITTAAVTTTTEAASEEATVTILVTSLEEAKEKNIEENIVNGDIKLAENVVVASQDNEEKKNANYDIVDGKSEELVEKVVDSMVNDGERKLEDEKKETEDKEDCRKEKEERSNDCNESQKIKVLAKDVDGDDVDSQNMDASTKDIDEEVKKPKSSPQRSPKHLLPQIQMFSLTYTSLTATSVKLKWAHEQGNPGIINETRHFMVEMMRNSKTTAKNGSVTPTTRIVYQGTQSSCRISHLAPQEQYSFRVRTLQDDHLLVSNVLTITTPEHQPVRHHKRSKGQNTQHQVQLYADLQKQHMTQHPQEYHQASQHEQLTSQQDEETTIESSDQKCAIMIISLFTVLAVVVACLIHHFLTD